MLQAGGIPYPEDGEILFEADMQLVHIFDMGTTQYGRRHVYVIQGGTVTGTKINGSVMQGGLDFQLELSNGAMEIEQLLVIKTGDGNYVYLRNPGTATAGNDIRMVADFEVSNSSSYGWLNTGKYAGRRVVDEATKTMKIIVYDVAGVAVNPDSTNSFAVTEPSDVKDQMWDYRLKDPSDKNGGRSRLP
ncbi:MAG: DUF3237 domain-containing protein [Spirochaetales bacterium]|nr:DUF3237 domain-containing protein [Spirochaetales bacterium]